MTDRTSTTIEVMFDGLAAAGGTQFPERDSLASRLRDLVPKPFRATALMVDRALFQAFATASVEMWLRAVHSFLISASLTRSSPIWSSVAGYYSSHYSIRALSHLLGLFHLHRPTLTVRLEVAAKQLICNVEKGPSREHQFYWQSVKAHPEFTHDRLFTRNEEARDVDSDSRHRAIANYCDHVGIFPRFEVLDEGFLKARVERLASLPVSDPPIPRATHFPDLMNVQIVALLRLVRYRSFVDGYLGDSNRFWAKNRNPEWCRPYMAFQVVAPTFAVPGI